MNRRTFLAALGAVVTLSGGIFASKRSDAAADQAKTTAEQTKEWPLPTWTQPAQRPLPVLSSGMYGRPFHY